MGTFVGRETTGKTDNQRLRLHGRHRLHDTGRVALVLHPRVAELVTDVLDEFALEFHTRVPYQLVRHVCKRRPHLRVALVAQPALRELFLVDSFPLARGPCGHMYAVGHVAHVQLLGEIARPYRREHLLAHFAVQPRHAVGLLAGVQREHRHRELLVGVLGIGAAHANQVFPFDAQLRCIVADVLVEQTFFKIVVPRRHRRMAGVQAACANDFQRFVEAQAVGHVVHQALQTH